MKWTKYNPNPCGRNVDDCAVRAISAALGIGWDEAYSLLSANGQLMCDMPHGNGVWGAVLRQHGFYRHAIPNDAPDYYTTANFGADHPHGIHVLGFGTHVATVIDGVLYDSWDSRHEIPQYYWSKEDNDVW
jgi:hypothetical protein